MNFIKVATADEMTGGGKKLVTAGGKKLLLVNLNGKYYAVDNACPHMGGSLYEGKLEGSQVICPRHGSVFDVISGKVVKSGKLLMNVKVSDLKSYPVKEEDGVILIGIDG